MLLHLLALVFFSATTLPRESQCQQIGDGSTQEPRMALVVIGSSSAEPDVQRSEHQRGLLPVESRSSSNASSPKSAQESSRGGSFGPPNNNFDELGDNDENQDASDLNFSHMNAPQERLLAVKDLLSNQRSMDTNAMGHSISSAQADANHPQCSHKGRLYTNGQTVLIEDQPCLNCTCKRAILQCYLRVCPPIVSLEAHMKMQMASMDSLAHQQCKIVKEAHQCCPSVRCEPIVNPNQAQSQSVGPDLGINFTNSVTISLDNLGPGQVISVTPAVDEPVSTGPETSSEFRGDQTNLARNNQQVQSNRSIDDSHTDITTSTLNQAQPTDMKKRDSILLITSNPTGSAVHLSKTSQTETSRDSYQSQLETGVRANTTGHQDPSSALLDALLETVYSSAAQMNGLNLQGSCMINGSLYVEGSAVIPEGNVYCQYCYCIRQKIMCIKPKCHLYISGCTAKYSSEYACCPTSYSCNNPGSDASTNFLDRTGTSRLPARIQAALPEHSQAPSISAKLSAALDSLIRMAKPSSNSIMEPKTGPETDQVSPRQVDGADTNSLSSSLMSLMNSLGSLTTTKSPMLNEREPVKSTVGQTSSSTTSSTSTTSTSTTTAAPRKDTSESDEDEKDGEDEPEGEGDESSSSGEGNTSVEEEKKKPRIGSPKTKQTTTAPTSSPGTSKSPATTTTSTTTTSTTSTTVAPSSVSDFLEPMQKLGPLGVMSSSPSGCTENGRNYTIGEQIPTLESCKHCYCGIEGVKECKIIECALKIDHNCKPITPEGHCCPVRFECPSSGQNSPSSTQHSNEHQRFRLLDSHDANFKGVMQCKTELGERCGLGNGSEASRPEPPALPPFSLENIDGLSVADGPILDTTRYVDSLSTVNETLRKNMSQQIQEQQINTLTEELSRFIMQINQNSSAPATLDETSLSNGSFPELARPMRGSDYHSVEVLPTGDRTEPHYGVVGIPSIEPELVKDDLNQSLRLLMSSVEYQNPFVSANQNSPRDSRSTNAHSMTSGNQVITDNHRQRARSTDMPVASRLNSSMFKEFDQPEAINVSDDYMDAIDNSSLPSPSRHAREPNKPHIRPMRDQPNPVPSSGYQPTINPTTVVFDDDFNNPDHGPMHGNVTAYVFPANNHHNSTYLLLRQNSIHTDGTPSGLQAFDNLANLTRAAVEEPTTELIASNITSDGSTETPPNQPTTGTPLGLEADRTRETNGWLKSLSGLVQSFGRRLTGNGHNELQGAASARSIPDDSGSLLPAELRDESTARSRKSSVLNSLLRSMIGTSSPSGNDLVMRPLASVMQVEPIEMSRENDSRPILSPYETGLAASGSSNVEIVTAVAASEPEIFGTTVKSTRAEPDKMSRRSDITDDLAMSENEEQVSVAHNLNSTVDMRQQQIKPNLCHDARTNRTYHPNEIIPKDDPCKTCTCILGKELCQTLVCPEKPAEDCREERVRGQCCASYTCTGNRSTSTTSAKLIMEPSNYQDRAINQHEPPHLRSSEMLQRARMHIEPVSHESRIAMPLGRANLQDLEASLRQRAQSPPQQLSQAAELQGQLPAHLRFRPNLASVSFPLSYMAKFDSNRMSPGSQRNPQSEPASIINRNQIGMQQNAGASHMNMKPVQVNSASIMHPQRPSILSPTHGYNSNFNQNQQTRRFSLDEDATIGPNKVWRLGPLPQSSATTSPVASRVNFSAKPADPINMNPVQPSAPVQPSESQSASSWKPSSSVLHFQPAKPTLAAASPPFNTNSFTGNSPDILPQKKDIERPALPVIPSQRPDITPISMNEVGSHQDRVHFQGQSSPQTTNIIVEHPRESGFMPISPPIPQPLPSLSRGFMGPEPPVTQEPSTTSTVGSLLISTSESGSFDTTVTPDTTTNNSQSPPSSSTGSSSTEQDFKSSSESDLSTTTATPEPTSTSSTVRTIVSTSTEPTQPNTDGETTQTSSDSSSSSENPNDFDPMGLFRVSECNIYGRLYKVGQFIEELSDSCKRCSCTPTGVDCISRC